MMSIASRAHRKTRPPRSSDARAALPATVLTIVLCLSLWVAAGSLVLAIADGLGPDPPRRLMIGLLLVLISVIALWRHRAICAVLRGRPWLVLPLAVAELAVVSADQVIGGPYVAFTMTALGLAIVVASPRMVWACVATMEAAYLMAVLIDQPPAALVRSDDLAGVLGQLMSYPFVALSLLGLAGLFKRFVADAPAILDAVRGGAPALTPALTLAIEQPGTRLLALPGARQPDVRLTRAEVRVVMGLTTGRTPKELAHAWGISLATVRSHIKHAKRKTGARTLPELASLPARADWPEVSRDGA